MRCLEAGGYCVGCLRTVAPQLAVNRGWLRLMAAVKAGLNPLRETPSSNPAVAKAERRNAKKATKAKRSQVGRICRLVAGQIAPACTTRVVASSL